MLHTSKTLTLISLLASVGLAVLPGCGDESSDEVDEGSDAVRKKPLDLTKYAYVTASVATGDEAKALEEVLKERGVKTIEEGSTMLAGLTARELEGGAHDPSANGESAYGIMCGKDGIGVMSCAVTVVVRTSDVTTVEREGITLVDTVKVTGRVASSILSALPKTSAPLIGSSATGYEPLEIACKGTSGHDEGAPVAECTIPTSGFGVMLTIKELTEGDKPMPKRDAEKMVRLFFPNG